MTDVQQLLQQVNNIRDGNAHNVTAVLNRVGEFLTELAQLQKNGIEYQVVHGELCYKSQEDDQSYGMWCPVNVQDLEGQVLVNLGLSSQLASDIKDAERYRKGLASGRLQLKGPDCRHVLPREMKPWADWYIDELKEES